MFRIPPPPQADLSAADASRASVSNLRDVLLGERDSLTARLREAEAEIAALRAEAPVPAAASVGGVKPVVGARSQQRKGRVSACVASALSPYLGGPQAERAAHLGGGRVCLLLT